MTTFKTKYSESAVAKMFPNLKEADKGATIAVTISYEDGVDGSVDLVDANVTVVFPSGEEMGYTEEMSDAINFEAWAIEHAGGVLNKQEAE